ncbi:MAG: O-antigen ligase family protein, partial [Candidatus Aquicultorales bacterium]
YFVVVQTRFDERWLKKLILGLLCFAILLALFGIAQRFIGIKMPALVDMRETTIKGRIVSTFANPNNLGGFILLLLPAAIAMAIERCRPGIRLVAGLSVAAMLPALILTYSRGAWIGFVVALLILSALTDRRIVLGLIVATAAVFLFLPNVIDRLVFAFSEGYMKTSSEAGRLFYWKRAVQVMATNPFFGVGAGRFGGAVAAIFGAPANTIVGLPPNFQLWVDSQIFQILAELGILGLLSFFWVPLTFARNIVPYIRREKDPFWRAFAAGAVASVGGILVQGMVVGVWETHQIAAFFWLLMAVAVSVMLRRREVEA